MSNFLVGRGLNDAAYDVFSGTGAQTVFSLTSASSTSAATVSISGVVQRPVTDYSVAGTTLTFVAAPPSGTNNILVQYNKSITIGTPADGTITTAKIADDAVTLAKMAGGTDGNLITFDANGDPAYVSTGTSTQVLTSNGAGAAPTFQDAAGGAWEFVESVTAAGSTTLEIGEANIASGYDYLIVGTSLKFSADPGQDYPLMRVGTGGGPTYQTTSYNNCARTTQGASQQLDADSNTTGHVMNTGTFQWGGTTAGELLSFEIFINNPESSSINSHFYAQMWGDTSSAGEFGMSETAGERATAETITGFQILVDGAKTIDSGTLMLFRRTRS